MKADRALLLLRDVPLARRTTLCLGGAAAALVRIGDVDTACKAADWAREHAIAVAILGGGSNTVVDDGGVDALVLEPTDCSLSTSAVGDAIHIRAGAGLNWDELVAFSVRRNLSGIAALSGIPGRVGAAPVQNIGAYGEQLADVFVAATCLDLVSGAIETWDAARASFAYRDSRWKREPQRPRLILDVTLALSAANTAQARYPDLRAALSAAGHDADAAPLRALRDAVLTVRRRKSMVVDALDVDSRSVGSFFVNPAVSSADADAAEAALGARAKGQARANGQARSAAPAATAMPRFGLPNGDVKLSAAWLIERCGWQRGMAAAGGVGLSTRHVLALVHRQGGSSEALWALAEAISADVHNKTGIVLVAEPQRLVGRMLDS